jgi:hypothetical protein
MEAVLQENIICKKYDIYLHKKTSSYFSLHLHITNPNIIIPNLINLDIYTLIAKLNPDVLERIQITNVFSENKKSILFIFKKFGTELGISQKYMHTLIEQRIEHNTIIFSSKSIPLTQDIPDNCDMIYSNNASLTVHISNPHDIKIAYNFHMDINEDLPIYMENISGLLMKKIFIRLKEFIEQIK